jgi:hypothetical protein
MTRSITIIVALSFLVAAAVSGFRLYTETSVVISDLTLPASIDWSGVYVTAISGVIVLVVSRR